MRLMFLLMFVLAETAGLSEEVVIKIKLSELKLYLLEKMEVVREYEIAGPKSLPYPVPLVRKMSRIILNPPWYPTEKTRKDLKQRDVVLPRVILNSDPRNPLGVAAIYVRWDNTPLPILIHGTNDPQTIGQRITRGCIRLKNDDIMELIERLRIHIKIKVIIEA